MSSVRTLSLKVWTDQITEQVSKLPIGRLSEVFSQVASFTSIWWTHAAETLSMAGSKVMIFPAVWYNHAAQTLSNPKDWGNTTITTLAQEKVSSLTDSLRSLGVAPVFVAAGMGILSIGAVGFGLKRFISKRRAKVD